MKQHIIPICILVFVLALCVSVAMLPSERREPTTTHSDRSLCAIAEYTADAIRHGVSIHHITNNVAICWGTRLHDTNRPVLSVFVTNITGVAGAWHRHEWPSFTPTNSDWVICGTCHAFVPPHSITNP